MSDDEPEYQLWDIVQMMKDHDGSIDDLSLIVPGKETAIDGDEREAWLDGDRAGD